MGLKAHRHGASQRGNPSPRDIHIFKRLHADFKPALVPAT
jgi:hypothetical protein